jgi:YVTN family beta-propeller protein
MVVVLPRVAAAQPFAYVTNHATGAVHVFNTADWTAVTTIQVGTGPTGIAISADGTFAYVANHDSDSVSRIDVASNTVTATIPVPGGPNSVAITPDSLTAYVVQTNSCVGVPTPTPGPGPTQTPVPAPTPNPTPAPIVCTVAVIDTTSNTVTGTIDVGPYPFAIAMSSSGSFAYVTNTGDIAHPGSVSVIDARPASPSRNTVVNSVTEATLGASPEGIAVGAGKIFVTNDTVNNVTVIREVDLQIVGTIKAGGSPFGVAVSPDGTIAAVSNDHAGLVSLIDLTTNLLIGSRSVGANPNGVTILPSSQYAVVANSSGSSLSVVPLWPGGTARFVSIFGSPTAVAITPDASFRLSMEGFPDPAQEAGQLAFTMTYTNVGTGPSIPATLTYSMPDDLTFVSAIAGGVLQPTLPQTVTWDIPSLAPGVTGSTSALFLVNYPLPFGTTITSSATIDDFAGHNATALESIASTPPGVDNLEVKTARINIFSSSRGPKDSFRLKAKFTPQTSSPFEPPFDPATPMSVVVATETMEVLRYDIPANTFIANRRGTSFHLRMVDFTGGRVAMRVRPKGVFGDYEIGVAASRQTFAPPDSTLMSISILPGTQAFETFNHFSTRQFNTRVQYSLP